MKQLTVVFVVLGFSMTFCNSQSLHVALSPLQILSQNVGKTNMKITYSRPAMRGRTIFGDLVPYNTMWRTGANRNSKIQFSEDVSIDGKTLEAGTYGIFAKPSKRSWEVNFYRDTTYWEVPRTWNDSLVALSVTVPSETRPHRIESMTFSFDDLRYDGCNLSLTWENTSISIPIKVFTEKQMMKAITKVLSGPRDVDYNAAASYRLQTGEDLEQGLVWIDKAIEKRKPASYYDYFTKAKILYGLNQKREAEKWLEHSKEMATADNHAYGLELIELFENSLNP